MTQFTNLIQVMMKTKGLSFSEFTQVIFKGRLRFSEFTQDIIFREGSEFTQDFSVSLKDLKICAV